MTIVFEKMKFAIITPIAPPSQSGQAIVLFRLLKDLNPEDYIIISPQDYSKSERGSDISSTHKLQGKYFYLPSLSKSFLRLLLRLNKIRLSAFIRIYLKYRTNKIIKILMAERCTGVIGCTADLIDPYCSFHASKKISVPFIFYTFDDYIDQWTNPTFFYFSKNFGPEILKGANKVIVPNEFLKKYYLENFEIISEVIHNPVNINDYAEIKSEKNDNKGKKLINIVYTGAIYGAQMDAFENFLNAIELLNNEKIIVSLYSNQQCQDFILKHNSPNIFCRGYQHSSLIPGIQKDADILFLPLAFNSEFSHNLVNTSSPGKMGEYLAAGRPILVHAPHDSFVNWYFRTHDCGFVVGENSSEVLANKIVELISNSTLREHLSKSSFQRAKEDFDEDIIKNKFYAILWKVSSK